METEEGEARRRKNDFFCHFVHFLKQENKRKPQEESDVVSEASSFPEGRVFLTFLVAVPSERRAWAAF